MRQTLLVVLVLALTQVAGERPATAGLIYDWASLEVFDGDGLAVDPPAAGGQVRLKNRARLGEIATDEDVAALHFRDPTRFDWGLEQRLRAQLVPDLFGLGLGGGGPVTKGKPRLKEAFLRLSDRLGIGGTVTELSFTTLNPTTKLPPGSTEPTRWSWELRVRDNAKVSTLLYQGTGYWQLDASSVGVPEPSSLPLLVFGLALLRRRRD